MNNIAGLFGVASLAGLVTMCWGQIKILLSRVTSLAVVTATFRGQSRTIISFYAMHKLTKSKYGDRTFDACRRYVRPVRKFISIIFESVGHDPLLMFHGRIPLLVWLKKAPSNDEESQVHVSFIRGLMKLDNFIGEAEEYYNAFSAEGKKRFQTHRCYGTLGSKTQSSGRPRFADETDTNEAWMMGKIVSWDAEDIGESKTKDVKAMDLLAYPKNVNEIYGEIQRWLKSEDWHKDRGIAWKMGILLEGQPGTGKSAFVRAVGIDLDLPIYILDIATMTNEEFVTCWEKSLSQAPVIILLEDFDAVFKGRKRVDEVEGGLTFDCLLSRISGVENSDGVVLMITTNDKGSIDPAIGQRSGSTVSRPGRIDIILKFQAMEEPERRKLAGLTMNGMREEVIEETVQRGHGETGAQFQARCAALALDFYWSQHQPKPCVHAWERILGRPVRICSLCGREESI